MKTIKTLAIATVATLAATFGASAMAMTPWQAHHEHRVEHRIEHHRDHRINRALEHGRITPHQARVLHAENHNRF
jgi:hypothetical protein